MKQNIEEILADATVFGTGFIPVDEKQWWFAVGNKKYWKKNNKEQLRISYTAIGGHVEEGETFIDATLREVNEETGVDASIQDSIESYYVEADLDDKSMYNFQVRFIKPIRLDESIRPWIIYKLQRKEDTFRF